MDFKARLRKVSGSKDTSNTKSSNSPTKAESPNEQLKLDKRESFGNSTNNTDGGLATSQITEQQSDTGKGPGHCGAGLTGPAPFWVPKG